MKRSLLSLCALLSLALLLASCGPVVAIAGLSGGGGGGGGGPVAPGIAMNPGTVVFVVGFPVVPLAPTHESGSPPDRYSIAPALPLGLAMDPATGSIGGLPLESSPPILYEITATNAAGSGKAPITITVLLPAAKRAYVANPETDTVSIYNVNASSGLLEPRGSKAAGKQPAGLALCRSLPFLYALNAASRNVTAYRIEADGDLDVIGTTPPSSTGTGPSQILCHPTGMSLYVLNSFGFPGTVSVFAVDPTAGSLAPLARADTGPFPTGMAIHPAGVFLYVVTGDRKIQQFSIAPNGELGLVTALSLSFQGGRIAIAPGGSFAYVLDTGDKKVRVLRIAANGTLSLTGALGETGVFPSQLRLGPEGRFLYVSSFNRVVDVFRVNRSDGSLTRLPAPPSSKGVPVSFGPDPSRRFAYVMSEASASVELFPIKPDGSLDVAKRSSFQLAAAAQSIVYTIQKPPIPPARFGFVASAASNRIQGFRVHPEVSRWKNTLGLRRNGRVLEPLDSVRSGAVPVAALSYQGSVIVANRGSHDLSVYRNAAGRLEERGRVPLRPNPESLATDGRFVYVGSPGSLQVFGPSKDEARLRQVFATGLLSRPAALAADAPGRFLFVADADADRVVVFRIREGALEPVDHVSTATSPRALALDASGRFLYVAAFAGARVQGFRVDRESGRLSPWSEASTGQNPAAVAVLGSFLYVANEGSDTLGVYRMGARSLRALTPVPVAAGPRRITLLDGHAVVSSRDGSLSILTLDSRSGRLELRDTVMTGPMPGALCLTR